VKYALMDNDAKAAALCEQWLGELKGVDTGAVMTLGTGVGGGIVVGGKLLHGSSFQAGELGWMITNQEAGLKEMVAYTGARCSAVRMVERVNQELGNEDLADGLAAFAAIKSGNEEAGKIFRQKSWRPSSEMIPTSMVLFLAYCKRPRSSREIFS
jgi:predicted NBD/HSP70 family sugar kinase